MEYNVCTLNRRPWNVKDYSEVYWKMAAVFLQLTDVSLLKVTITLQNSFALKYNILILVYLLSAKYNDLDFRHHNLQGPLLWVNKAALMIYSSCVTEVHLDCQYRINGYNKEDTFEQNNGKYTTRSCKLQNPCSTYSVCTITVHCILFYWMYFPHS